MSGFLLAPITMISKRFKSINLKIKCLTLEEIGERYERMKLELFKERNKNREIIEDLQEVKIWPR